MNKALHAFVYLFLAAAGAALWFELQLSAKHTLLTDRDRQKEDAIVKLAKTIEKAEPSKDAETQIMKDTEGVEARIVEEPAKENILDGYKMYLEQQNLDTFNWESKREQLRAVYKLDENGNPLMDGGRPIDRGAGTANELFDALLQAAIRQQSTLNTTRAELAKLRGILADVVEELNDTKQHARQDKVTILEKDEKIEALDRAKADAEAQVVKIKGSLEELNGEIASLRDEAESARSETAQALEKLEEVTQKYANLEKQYNDAFQSAGSSASTVATTAAIPYGEKGKVVSADNEYMFATIEFSDEAMKQLKGEKLDKPIPAGSEFTIKRKGYNGPAGDIVGRVRTRQEIPGKKYVVCDIISAWRQDDVRADDVVFSD